MGKLIFKPDVAKRNYSVTILVDDEDAWIMPWAEKLEEIIAPYHKVFLATRKEEISIGDFAFLMGCTQILPEQYLKRNKINLVVHESDLPRGRGWSPIAWQVIEGVNHIPVVLFEARRELDSGPIYLRDAIELDGTELLPEIRKKQGNATIRIILKFLEQWPSIKPENQTGPAIYLSRRTTANDRLDLSKTLAENFDHLRIVDNERYPAWFEYRGQRYILKITKE
jgi:methionyl-tRNA formyltransferase